MFFIVFSIFTFKRDVLLYYILLPPIFFGCRLSLLFRTNFFVNFSFIIILVLEEGLRIFTNAPVQYAHVTTEGYLEVSST